MHHHTKQQQRFDPATARNTPRDVPNYSDTMGVRPICRIPSQIVRLLGSHQLTDQSLRLFLGLMHRTEQHAHHTTNGSEAVYDVAFIEDTSLLRTLIGPVASNDARAFKSGVEGLAATDLFRLLDLRNGSRSIVWAFSYDVLDMILDRNDRYGLLDLSDVRELSRALPIQFHLAFALVRKMRQPHLVFSVEDLALIQGKEGSSWEHMSRAVLKALQVVCALNNATAVVRLIDGDRPGSIGLLEVDLLHSETSWTEKRLARALPWPRQIVIVDDCGVKRCSRESFRAARVEELLQRCQKRDAARAGR